jgi:subtilisin family serine protease
MRLLKLLLLSSLIVFSVYAKSLTVMVIDTGLDMENKELVSHVPKEFRKSEWQDIHRPGHGTHVTGLVMANACRNVVLIPCKYYREDGGGYNNIKREIECIQLALQLKVDLINISGGGNDSDGREKALVVEFLKAGGTLVAAAGNDGRNIDTDPYYPACYPSDGCVGSIVVVGSIDKDGIISSFSNFGRNVVYERGQNVESWLPGNKRGTMTGTSQATAIRSGRIIKAWCDKNGSN